MRGARQRAGHQGADRGGGGHQPRHVALGGAAAVQQHRGVGRYTNT